MQEAVKEHFQIFEVEALRELFYGLTHQVITVLHQFVDNLNLLIHHCFFLLAFSVFIITYWLCFVKLSFSEQVSAE